MNMEKKKAEQDIYGERLENQINFIREMDKEKFIGRQTYLSDGKRKENDAEHAWHLALMTALLSEYAKEKIDVQKTMLMVLIHDIVEIDAGDTYAYDEEGKLSQREREVKAADRIFNLLPEDQAKSMRDLWEEFEACETPEAKFARCMDNLQPILLNDKTEGKSWRERQIKRSQVEERQKRTKMGSDTLMEVVNQIIEKNVENGNLKDE